MPHAQHDLRAQPHYGGADGTIRAEPSHQHRRESLSFKPKVVGLSRPFGNWFMDAAAGTWLLFTDSDNFFGGQRRSQSPMPIFQWHGGYSWRFGLWLAADATYFPSLWLAADATYFTGDRTSINGVEDQDYQISERYGTTLSVPLAAKWSARLAWSRGLATRVGGNFQTVSIARQYRCSIADRGQLSM